MHGRWCIPSHDLVFVPQDPSIKQMAEQIAQDPAFAQMTAALQASMGGAPGAPGEGAGARDAAAAEARQAADGPQIDPEQYASAMSSVLQNQQFMEMAEKLGQSIMLVGTVQPLNRTIKHWGFLCHSLQSVSSSMHLVTNKVLQLKLCYGAGM
jgi:hypothetical protein